MNFHHPSFTGQISLQVDLQDHAAPSRRRGLLQPDGRGDARDDHGGGRGALLDPGPGGEP